MGWLAECVVGFFDLKLFPTAQDRGGIIQFWVIGCGKGVAPGFDLVAVFEAFKQPATSTLVDGFEFVGLEPVPEFLVIAAAFGLVCMGRMHGFRAADKECLADKEPVSPTLTISKPGPGFLVRSNLRSN